MNSRETKQPIATVVWVTIISGVVTLASLLMTLTIKQNIGTVKQDVVEVHKQINSRMDELLKINKELSYRLGIESEIDKQDSLRKTKSK